MTNLQPRLLTVGDAAYTVEFGNTIDPGTHALVLGFAHTLDAMAGNGLLDGVVEWVPTFRSVTVHFDPDRADPAQLADTQVVRLMTDTVFRVYMVGFLPGFPYLGGLPAAIEMPRLAKPRKVVPARSIAVAGRMCAAYPWESPGGWRLLGRTPVRLFDAANPRRPALLAPGDEVCWRAVDRAEYRDIEDQIGGGAFNVTTLLAAGESV